jgi:hypothetical protein
MTTLLTALCVTLGVAVTVLFIAWGRAERALVRAERKRDQANSRAIQHAEALQRHRQADAALNAHWHTVPREKPAEPPTLQFPTFTRPTADTPTQHLHSVHPAPYRFPRKDHNQR